MSGMSDMPKFVPLEHIMSELSISKSQAYALVRSAELRAIQVGGRGHWRVSLDAFEDLSGDRTGPGLATPVGLHRTRQRHRADALPDHHGITRLAPVRQMTATRSAHAPAEQPTHHEACAATGAGRDRRISPAMRGADQIRHEAIVTQGTDT